MGFEKKNIYVYTYVYKGNPQG